MRRPRLPAKPLFAALDAGAIVVLGLVVARSITRPHLTFDLWSYHLPFAARLHGLGGGADGFLLAPVLAALWDGYPKAWDWIQGWLWKTTGDLRWIGLTASLPLVAWALHAGRVLGVPIAGLVFGALAVPMVAIHASVPYVDLPVAALLAIASLSAARLLSSHDRDASSDWRCADNVDGATVLGALALAGNSKYTATVFGLALAALLVTRAAVRSTGGRRRRLVAIGLAAGLVTSATLIRNTVAYGQPFHPLRAHLPGFADRYDSIDVPVDSPDYLPQLGVAARPVYLVFSITELDWLVRGVEPEYSLGSTSGDHPARFGPARTGGWWGPYVTGLVAFVAWTRRRARRGGLSDPLAHELGLQLVVLVTVQALVPHGHSLRFWMAVPLLLVALAVRLGARTYEPVPARTFLVVMAAAAVASVGLLPSKVDLSPWPIWDYSPKRFRIDFSDNRLEEAVAREQSFCLDGRHYPFQFKASAAVTGGSFVVEQVRPGEECRILPKLDVPQGALHYWGLRKRPTPAP